MAIPERALGLLRSIGQVAAEVPSSGEQVRAFVTVYCSRTAELPGAGSRYHYLGQPEFLYRAIRFQVSCEILERGYDVCEEEMWDLQSVVLPDEAALEFVLRLWLPDLEALVEPRLTDVPI